MPQHPTRHDAPTDQLHTLDNLQIKRELAGDAYRLANFYLGVDGPQMR
jgi:hypothetical protein